MDTIHVQYYYDWTQPKRYSQDAEGNLVQLCDRCVRGPQTRREVSLAQRGDDESSCEICGRPAPNHEGVER